MSDLTDPTGFWSYARHDGDHSDGRMAELHGLIAHELGSQLAIAGAVDIFRDQSAIHTGDEWEKMIRGRLAKADFLIAILTPNFLSRKWCCEEIMLFREREKALGRSNLIFPVEYIDIAPMRGRMKSKIADPDALTLLDSRQIKSFTEFRFTDPKSPPVRAFVAALCREIADRLYDAEASAAPDPTPSRPEPGKPVSAVAVELPKPAVIRKPPMPGTVIQEHPGPEMVLIPPGTFTMGVPEAESKREGTEDTDKHARPQHKVSIARPFWLGKYPVTRGQYAVFATETGRGGDPWASTNFEQDDRHPVVNVSHQDAQAYLKWLSDRTGHMYRLPSEAEWEYAARAGQPAARYWGEAAGKPGEHAHFSSTLGLAGGTCPVGTFRANDFGLYEMLGNVWEWIEDNWHENYDGSPADGTAWIATVEVAARRVLRGGSWANESTYVRSASREGFAPSSRYVIIGFRCARSLSENEA